MNAIETAKRELRELGFDPVVVSDPACSHGPVLVFRYPVTHGPHRGTTFRIGISFQEDAYPEYPPHFVHVADLAGSRLTRHSSYQYQQTEWSVFSLPPSDFWDGLPPADKNMRTYLHRHLARVWAQI